MLEIYKIQAIINLFSYYQGSTGLVSIEKEQRATNQQQLFADIYK